MRNCKRCRIRRRGLSLIELVGSTLLVAIVLVGALRGVGGVLKTSAVVERQFTRTALARQLMSEILQQRYEEPDTTPLLGLESPETSADRLDWDDVDDYHGLSGVPRLSDGTSLPGYSMWSRSVTVEYLNVDDPQTSSTTDEGLKRITVTVTDPSGIQATLVAFRSRWGLLQQAPAADLTAQTWVGSELQPGSGTPLFNGVVLGNHVEDQN